MIKNIRIKKSIQDKWITGIIGGISKKYELNSNIIRLILIGISLIAPFTMIITIPAYLYALTHMQK